MGYYCTGSTVIITSQALPLRQNLKNGKFKFRINNELTPAVRPVATVHHLQTSGPTSLTWRFWLITVKQISFKSSLLLYESIPLEGCRSPFRTHKSCTSLQHLHNGLPRVAVCFQCNALTQVPVSLSKLFKPVS